MAKITLTTAGTAIYAEWLGCDDTGIRAEFKKLGIRPSHETMRGHAFGSVMCGRITDAAGSKLIQARLASFNA